MLWERVIKKFIQWAGEVRGKDVVLLRSRFLRNVSHAGMWALIAGAACAIVPVVQLTCVIL
jgi:hypothetical protein